ncbi:MAG TPA: hypothetical protein VFV05_02810 [Methylomirabilota bacterium]|nr:hypothetical protein [Methylomirabilota bacterium]
MVASDPAAMRGEALAEQLPEMPRALFGGHPLGVEDEVVEQRVVDVDVVEDPHARGSFAVRLAHDVERGLGREPLLLLDPAGTVVLGRVGAHAKRVADVPQRQRGREPGQDDVVACRHVENACLDERLESPVAVGEALPERRLLLGVVPNLGEIRAEALGRLGDDLPVSEPPAEGLGQPPPKSRCPGSLPGQLKHGEGHAIWSEV